MKEKFGDRYLLLVIRWWLVGRDSLVGSYSLLVICYWLFVIGLTLQTTTNHRSHNPPTTNQRIPTQQPPTTNQQKILLPLDREL
jgi:hypothetical protein